MWLLILQGLGWPIHSEPKVVSHGHYIALSMAEVATSRRLIADILCQIAELRPPTYPAPVRSANSTRHFPDWRGIRLPMRQRKASDGLRIALNCHIVRCNSNYFCGSAAAHIAAFQVPLQAADLLEPAPIVFT